MARTCAFCGGSELSNEHVIPQWLGALMPHREIRQITIPDNLTPQARGTHDTADNMVTGRVCESCNSGWMNEIETAARPYIEPMALGRGVVVPREAQAMIATWIVKTCLTAMLTTKEWPRIAPLFPEFCKQRKPTDFHLISVTGYSGERWCSLFHFQRLFLDRKGDGDSIANTVEGHLFTLLVGHLVAHILYLPIVVGFEPLDPFHAIWPTVGDFVWPGGIINATRLESLAKTDMVGKDGKPPESIPWMTLS